MRSEFLSEFLSHLLRRFEVPFHHTDVGERKCLSKLPFGECDRISKKSRRLISPYYVVMYRRISPAIDGTGVEPVWPALSGFLRNPIGTSSKSLSHPICGFGIAPTSWGWKKDRSLYPFE